MLTCLVLILFFVAVVVLVLFLQKPQDSNWESFLETCPCTSKPRYPDELYHKVLYKTSKRHQVDVGYGLARPINKQRTSAEKIPEPHPPIHTPTSSHITPHSPTTHSPTSHSPTSHSPTTHSPTSHSPTSHSPTSHSPTSHSPTTHSPTSHSPTSHSPTSHSPPPIKYRSKPTKKPRSSKHKSYPKKQPIPGGERNKTHSNIHENSVRNHQRSYYKKQPIPGGERNKAHSNIHENPARKHQQSYPKTNDIIYSSQIVDPARNQVDELNEDDWYNWPNVINQPEPDSCGAVYIEPTRSSATAGIYPKDKNCNVNQYLTIINKHPNVTYDVECQVTPNRIFRCENMEYGKKCYFPPYLNAGKYQCITSQPNTLGGKSFTSKITVGSSDSPDYTYPKILNKTPTILTADIK